MHFGACRELLQKVLQLIIMHRLFMRVQLLYNPMQQQWYLSIPLNVIFDTI